MPQARKKGDLAASLFSCLGQVSVTGNPVAAFVARLVGQCGPGCRDGLVRPAAPVRLIGRAGWTCRPGRETEVKITQAGAVKDCEHC